jgi:hypothetical protein
MYREIRQQSRVGTLDRIVASSWNVMCTPGSLSARSVTSQYNVANPRYWSFIQKTVGVAQVSSATSKECMIAWARLEFVGRWLRMPDILPSLPETQVGEEMRWRGEVPVRVEVYGKLCLRMTGRHCTSRCSCYDLDEEGCNKFQFQCCFREGKR